jgi:hypothetical protein
MFWSSVIIIFRSTVLIYNQKRPLGRPRSKWKDNGRMGHGERGWEGVDWIRLAQDRDQWRAVVNMVMSLRVR